MSITQPTYGQIDQEYARRLRALPAERDQPLLMCNLMKYRPVAVYEDGRETDLTGRQADDRYAPLDILADLGAELVLFGDVVDQPRGDEQWDRVAIVRYPTAAAFMAMQLRQDFQERHVHKDAGMERTIISLCRPLGDLPPLAGAQLLTVDLVGHVAPEKGDLEVAGTVVGDGRVWSALRLSQDPSPSLVATDGPATTVRMRPLINTLAAW